MSIFKRWFGTGAMRGVSGARTGTGGTAATQQKTLLGA